MPSLVLQVAAPSSSALHGSPGLLPLKSQLVPLSVRRQPPGPLQGDSMKRPAWQTSSRLASRHRASPLSHELPAVGLQCGSANAPKAHEVSRMDQNCKARPSLLPHAREQGDFRGADKIATDLLTGRGTQFYLGRAAAARP